MFCSVSGEVKLKLDVKNPCQLVKIKMQTRHTLKQPKTILRTWKITN